MARTRAGAWWVAGAVTTWMAALACTGTQAGVAVQVRVAEPPDVTIPLGANQVITGDYQVNYESASDSPVDLLITAPDGGPVTVLGTRYRLAENSSSDPEGRYTFTLHPVNTGVVDIRMEPVGGEGLIIRQYPGQAPPPYFVRVTVQ